MKHLEPKEAFDFLQANPEAVFIDVRSEMEHMFVGHPRGSILIPMGGRTGLGNRPAIRRACTQGSQRQSSCCADLPLRTSFC